MQRNRAIILSLAASLGAALLAGCASMKPAAGEISHEQFGTTQDGKPVEIYTLRNERGMEARILTFGGIIQTLKVPDRDGHLDDVVLGYNDLPNYETNSPYFGALIGRYGNRIARGHFTLDGKTYTLATNNYPNALHGGLKGFDKVVWEGGEACVTSKGPQLVLRYFSKDGEEGYPGNLTSYGSLHARRRQFAAPRNSKPPRTRTRS